MPEGAGESLESLGYVGHPGAHLGFPQDERGLRVPIRGIQPFLLGMSVTQEQGLETEPDVCGYQDYHVRLSTAFCCNLSFAICIFACSP